MRRCPTAGPGAQEASATRDGDRSFRTVSHSHLRMVAQRENGHAYCPETLYEGRGAG